MKTGHKVTIGSCDPGSVNGSFAYTLIQLAQARSSRLGPFVRIKGSGLLSKQRNRVVKQFLDNTDSDWLLMLDSDEQLSVSAFDALIDTAHDKDRPIVAGLVFAGFGVPGKAYPKPVPCIFQDSDKGFLPRVLRSAAGHGPRPHTGSGCRCAPRGTPWRPATQSLPPRGNRSRRVESAT